MFKPTLELPKPTPTEADWLAKATDRIHAAIDSLCIPGDTTYALTEGCDVDMFTGKVGQQYRLIHVRNHYLSKAGKPSDPGFARMAWRDARTTITVAARPARVTF